MAERFDVAALAAIAGEQVGLSPAGLRLQPIGTGKHNSSYCFDAKRERYVLRRTEQDAAGFLFYERLMMCQEPELHALIHQRTRTRLPRSSPPTLATRASTATTS